MLFKKRSTKKKPLALKNSLYITNNELVISFLKLHNIANLSNSN